MVLVHDCRKWLCSKHEDQCIKEEYRCDGGAPDCRDETDEVDGCTTTAQTTTVFECPANRFQCKTVNECIVEAGVCDKEEDCSDGSDEVGCATETTTLTATSMTATDTTTTVTTYTQTYTSTTTTLDYCLTSKLCATRSMFIDAQTDYPLTATVALCRACAHGVSVEAICEVFVTLGCPEKEKEVDQALKAAAAQVTNFRVDLAGAEEEAVKEGLAAAFGSYRSLRASDVVDIELNPVEGSMYAQIVLYLKSTAREQVLEEGPLGFQKGLSFLLEDGTKLHIHNGDVVDVDAIKANGKVVGLEGSGDADDETDVDAGTELTAEQLQALLNKDKADTDENGEALDEGELMAARDAAACARACAADSDIAAIEKCAMGAGTDIAAATACSAELLACNTECELTVEQLQALLNKDNADNDENREALDEGHRELMEALLDAQEMKALLAAQEETAAANKAAEEKQEQDKADREAAREAAASMAGVEEKSGGNLVIVIILVVVLLGAGGGLYYVFNKRRAAAGSGSKGSGDRPAAQYENGMYVPAAGGGGKGGPPPSGGGGRVPVGGGGSGGGGGGGRAPPQQQRRPAQPQQQQGRAVAPPKSKSRPAPVAAAPVRRPAPDSDTESEDEDWDVDEDC
jgi:hypothetical protein